MNWFKSCVPCIPNKSFRSDDYLPLTTEKPDLPPFNDNPAMQFLDVLQTTNSSGEELEKQLRSVISTTSLSEKLAAEIVRGIEDILKRGIKVADTMNKAVNTATDTALQLAEDHPYYASLIAAGTLIAIGVLVLVAPWIIEVLGFSSRGPRAGKIISPRYFHS